MQNVPWMRNRSPRPFMCNQVQREREESLARTQKARDLIQEQETVLKNIYLKLALGDAEGHGSSGAHAPSAAGHGGSLYRSSASRSASSFHEASTFEQQARKVGELIEQREVPWPPEVFFLFFAAPDIQGMLLVFDTSSCKLRLFYGHASNAFAHCIPTAAVKHFKGIGAGSMVSSEGDRLSGDMEDDSWADGTGLGARSVFVILDMLALLAAAGPPPQRLGCSMSTSSHSTCYDFLKDHAIHDPSILEVPVVFQYLRIDSDAGSLIRWFAQKMLGQTLSRSGLASSLSADALPAMIFSSRSLEECGYMSVLIAWTIYLRVLRLPSAELEDDSWADAIVPGSVQNSGHGVPGSRNALQRVLDRYCPISAAEWWKSTRTTPVLAPASSEIFAEVFAMSRFRAEFPAAEAGLPLLVGLDFEWKPDRGNPSIQVVSHNCFHPDLGMHQGPFAFSPFQLAFLPTWLRAFLETGDEVVKAFMSWTNFRRACSGGFLRCQVKSDRQPLMLPPTATASFDVSDKQKLQTSFGWDFDANAGPSPHLLLTLQSLRESVGDIPYGMARMATFFELPMQKLKVIGSSNWAREAGLTSQQKEYAADDAFFQLFLLGKLLDHRPPEDSNTSLQKMLQQFRITREAMEKVLKRVDNSAYRKNFFQLRDVVRDATDLLSKALGSGGCTNINDLNRLKVIQKFMEATARTCPIHVSANFLKQNMDIFVVFFREGQLRVRLRLPEDGDEELEDPSAGDQVAPDMSAEDAAKLVAEVQELLAKYEPPVEKRRTVMHRNVPEPFWVPARAILTRQRIALLEACLADGVDSLESSFDGEDGVLLRLTRWSSLRFWCYLCQ
ncbi:unnamed protein product, partial [Polarella glacialis]